MHELTIPPEIAARVAARCGTEHPFADLVPARTAFIVIDMQVGFMDPAIGHAACPMAPRIVATSPLSRLVSSPTRCVSK